MKDTHNKTDTNKNTLPHEAVMKRLFCIAIFLMFYLMPLASFFCSAFPDCDVFFCDGMRDPRVNYSQEGTISDKIIFLYFLIGGILLLSMKIGEKNILLRIYAVILTVYIVIRLCFF